MLTRHEFHRWKCGRSSVTFTHPPADKFKKEHHNKVTCMFLYRAALGVGCTQQVSGDTHLGITVRDRENFSQQ